VLDASRTDGQNVQFFDTHAHLDDEQFEGIREDVIARAIAAQLTGIVAVGTSAASSQQSLELAEKHEIIHAAVGIQPNSCAEAEPGDWERVVALAERPQVVALGETGLDRYWDFSPFELQQDYFDRHLRLSQARRLPFIVHMRDCSGDLLEMLREANHRDRLYGVMHSFTGDVETATECIDLGLYISFAGMVTYKKSDELRAVAASVPDDRLLIETDSPYLSPHPVRGQRPNEPACVVHTASCLAEVRGVTIERLAQQTTENGQRLFGI